MNVLMLVKNSEVGGVASCVKSLTEGLKRYRNIDTVIGICEGESLDYMLKGKHIHVIEFDAKTPVQIIKNYKIIAELVKKYHIDIIHSQNRIPALYAGVYHFFHKKTPYIWSNHLVPISSNFFHRITTWYGECAVAEGVEGQKMLIEQFHIPAEKVKIVNLGVDLTNFEKTPEAKQIELRERYGISKNEKVILLYGRLDAVKGHLFLLNALKDIAYKDYKLIFPGENDAYKQEIVARANLYGLEKKLIFPGYINGAEWLSIADLMVLPSRSEGFGIVNVESFVMEVPVIRTKTGGYEDMKDLCFGIDYGDVSQLSTLLKEFFEGNSKFQKKKNRAKLNAARFSLENYTDGYYKIYEDAVRSARHFGKID